MPPGRSGLRQRRVGDILVEQHIVSAEQLLQAIDMQAKLPVMRLGESLVALRERVLATLNELAARHTGQQIVLVAHGGVLDILYRAATRLELQAPRTWALTNTAVNRLLWTPQGLSLVGWGDTSHLDARAQDETTV